MARGRSRSGYTILALLVVILIIGYLYERQLGGAMKRPGGVDEKVQARLPEEAKNQAFHIVATQVQAAVAMSDAEGKPRPLAWTDLSRFGIDTLIHDPWGGRYYLKDGRIRCTGNPKASEPL